MSHVMDVDIQSPWARLLFASLYEAGLRDVVISPGSRSTPFVFAAAERDRFRLYDMLDERVAGFFALGQGRVTRRPSLLLCTSGTAAAHYLPAVIEADASGVPLLVLSADRPLELHDCGANQTMAQRALLTPFVRRQIDVGEPSDASERQRGLGRRMVQAYAAALGPKPGPVHLNAVARKPLAPQFDSPQLLSPGTTTTHTTKVFRPTLLPDRAAVALLAEACRRAEGRGLIVCGPKHDRSASERQAIENLAAHLGYPLLTEASSQLRYGASRATKAIKLGAVDVLFKTLSSSPIAESFRMPKLLIQFERSPMAAGWTEFAKRFQGERWVIDPFDWPDPEGHATAVVRGDVGETARWLRESTPHPQQDPEYITTMTHLEKTVWDKAGNVLASHGEPLSEAAVARESVPLIPDNGMLIVGNSLPIRMVDAWSPPGKGPEHVLSQRGVSGIDGFVAGAAGAVVASARPTLLLLGDISFLHDISGLYATRMVKAPLVIVVVNNGGGRIFEQLPMAKHTENREDVLKHFTTEHRHDFSYAAALYGCPFMRVKRVKALRRAIDKAFHINHCTIIEAMVPSHGARLDNEALVTMVREHVMRDE